MVQVQAHDVVSRGYRGPDRRRNGVLGKIQRGVIRLVRSRWVAMFAVAFAVSWCFHIVEDRNDAQIRHQQRIVICTIDGVAKAQEVNAHVPVRVILDRCDLRAGKE